jgi:hypothetical protein
MTKNNIEISPEARLYFRDQFRNAIASAQRDAEGFQEILFTIEKLGVTLSGEISSLGKYKSYINNFVESESSREVVAKLLPQIHLPFSELFDLVKDARNDALHSGAIARHITMNAIRLAIVLEDALMSHAKYVREFMVRDPVCAYLWQPLSLVRQQMLANSFTYLPIQDNTFEPYVWKLIADYEVAKYLHSANNIKERNALLAKRVQDAVTEGKLQLTQALTCNPNQNVQEITSTYPQVPFLVVDNNNPITLLGILTAFDLL